MIIRMQKFDNARRCDVCHKPHNMLYMGVQIGDQKYNIHNKQEIERAQKNYEENLSKINLLTNNQDDDTVYEDSNLDLE